MKNEIKNISQNKTNLYEFLENTDQNEIED